MTKAFLFDMDGVLADTESEWDRLGYDNLLIKHFGQKLFNQVKLTGGMSIKGIYEAFVQAGWQRNTYEIFMKEHAQLGQGLYKTIALSQGLTELVDYLDKQRFIIGVVSSSPIQWVKALTSRISNHQKITYLLSVNNHKTLKPKPAPDPYLQAMKDLCANPQDTIVLEDSLPGVASAKASGATVICFTQYHHSYDWQAVPDNADYYAKSMAEVRQIVDKSDKA